MQFRVTIHNSEKGDRVETIEAESRFAVYDQVQGAGDTVVDLAEGGAPLTLPPWLGGLLEHRISRQDIAQVVKNLSTMLGAGLSLSRALSVIDRETDNKKLKDIATSLAETVGKGSPFHEALAAYPAIFPDMLVAMVKVGEESGSLANSLSIVGTQMERSEELRRKIKGAFIYPCIIVIAIGIVSALMLLYVVPTLTKTFTELHVKLPLATQIFVQLSETLVNHTLIVFGIIAILVAALVAFVRSRRGSALLLKTGLHLPVIGELIQETYAARTARTLSSLLAAGVPVLEALLITKDVVRTPAFAAILDDAMVRVKKGEPLSRAFSDQHKTYPLLMSEMLIVGEETGKVAPMLVQVAEFYEGDVSQKTKDLSTIIEPVLMLLIGAVVGVFAVAMIAPIYSISSAI